MKKVFIMAYARKNLGDDLFIKMLLDRYSHCEFYMKINNYDFLSWLDKYSNLHVINGNDTDNELVNTDINDYDAFIYIGGSIFMEGGKVYNLSQKFLNFINKCKNNNKPFCYVSCNYGPYKTKEYFELSRKAFKTCTDICFRDKYSYNLFKDIKQVRYAPDFAFTYPISNNLKIPNSIGITVIDPSIRNDIKEIEKDYIYMLINNIKKYINADKKVYLYSFCKYEGDERIIDILINKFENNVVDVRYDGNVDEFLNLYSKMEYMICARFHAMILSSVANQKMYIMSYSKKIDNVVNDLGLNLPIVSFSEISENLDINIESFVDVDKDKISKIISKAGMQEEFIKKFIK